MLRIWYSCLNPTLRSVTNLAFVPAFPQTFSATNLAFAPEFLPSAVSRIWHSRLHTLRRSVHESCIRARISIFRRATNLAFAPAFPQVLPHLCHSPKDLTRDVTVQPGTNLVQTGTNLEFSIFRKFFFSQ